MNFDSRCHFTHPAHCRTALPPLLELGLQNCNTLLYIMQETGRKKNLCISVDLFLHFFIRYL